MGVNKKCLQVGLDVDSTNQDFKATIIDTFTKLKENMFKELKITIFLGQNFLAVLVPSYSM